MPIPPLNINGTLPPYVGPDGPGGAPEDMTPYVASTMEVTSVFGSSPNRADILSKWLLHREALNRLGIRDGFQWLDGSFVENKVPQDADVVTFYRRPPSHQRDAEFRQLLNDNLDLFLRSRVKGTYRLDAFFVDLSNPGEALVAQTRYWLGLFSHKREGDLWKGMIQVGLYTPDDDRVALGMLAAPTP